ncbi:MAG: hypothetical protein ACLFQA_10820, partial [Bacteroidales bacterium]
METLFRLMLTRPAMEQNEESPSIKLAQNTTFQAALGRAWQKKDPRSALKEEALKFIKSKDFTGFPEELAIYPQLKILKELLNEIEKKKSVTRTELVKAAEEAFGTDLAGIFSKKQLDTAVRSLKDSLIAIKLLPEQHRKPIEQLTNRLRDIELIFALDSKGKLPENGLALRLYRRRSVMLPSEADLKSALNYEELLKKIEEARRKEEERKRREAEAKFELYKNLKKAVKELTSLGEENFNTTPRKDIPGFKVAPDVTPSNIYNNVLKQQLQNMQFSMVAAQLGKGNISAGPKTEPQGSISAESGMAGSSPYSVIEPLFLSGSPDYKPINLSAISFRLKAGTDKKLSPATQKILKERNLNLTDHSLDYIVQALRTEITALSKELDGLFGRPMKYSFKRAGKAMIMIKTPVPTVWNTMVFGGDITFPEMTVLDMRVPHTHGSVAPAGIADLLVVKQQLVRYRGADVAHIENVLKGEKKEREHIRRRETEELIFRESEITTSEERSLESTSRFELSRETSETIKEEASLKAGLEISGKYGPVVEFTASAEGSLSRTKESATKTAAKFSQDVTERSASKVTQRLLERSSLRVTNEVTEKNMHGIDNTGGGGHIAGVYQWVEKVYEAQMYNYGLRTIYDFMVPEPGAFLIETMQSAHTASMEIEKPAPFTLRPDQITESNYHSWVKIYRATGITPPPEMYITKSLNFKAGGGDSKTDYSHSGQIEVDEGYKAIHGVVGTAATISDEKYLIDVVLSNRAARIEGSDWIWSTSLNDVTGSVAFGLQTSKVKSIAAILEVKTQRTDRAMMLWRLDTHAKLTNAYQARLSEYEEKLAQLEMQAGVAIEGKNPALNQDLMNDELKKNCISIMTQQHYDLFNAISMGINGMPQINLYENEAEGPYVRFFEQAFEWEHMTWVA